MLGLVNSHVLLILLYIGGQIPINTVSDEGLHGYDPYHLDESARIDGASHTKISIDIILPLSKPMIAVAAMNGLTGPLGDFAISSTILRKTEAYTSPSDSTFSQ